MAIITLTSDWKSRDNYEGAVKGRILTQCPDALIVDITNQILSFNISMAAYVLKNCFKYYPEGTIHIIGVASEQNKNHKHSVVLFNGHFFIGTDNGVWGLIFEDKFEKAILLNEPKTYIKSFPELFFAEVACHLAKGNYMNELGVPLEKLVIPTPLLPVIDENIIVGSVIYLDGYQNAITNITHELFIRVHKNRRFDIYVASNQNRISEISKGYQETSAGELLALFNSSGHLEIAICNGNAAELLKININSTVRIKFIDN